MWPTIDRARRRIAGGSPEHHPVTLAGALVGASAPQEVVIVAGGQELELLLRALQAFLGEAVERPDTPDRIERALALLIASRGGSGRTHVLRRPAGLSTPETWELHLEGVDPGTSDAVRDASRTGSF